MISVVRIDRQTWGIKSGFSNVVRFECKATPGMRWDDPNKAWVGYADAVAVTAARLQKRGLKVTGEVDTAVGIPIMPVAYANLRGYQNVGVEFLIAKAQEGAILADDLGLGKTIQAITAARALKCKTIIVCPMFVRGVWDSEIPRWWSVAKTTRLWGTEPNLIEGDPDVVIIHYDILHAWKETILQWGPKTIIIDEGDYLMSAGSRRTKSTMAIASVCSYRMMLAGTPVQSKIVDLWAPVETISPGRFGKWFGFAIRYAGAKKESIEIRVEGVKTTRDVWNFKGSSHLDELNARLKHFMLRRLKSDVALELPARTRQIITLEVDKKHIVAPSSALRSDKLLRKALDMAADGKFPQVIDSIETHLSKGAKVVVGTYRKHIADLIADGIRQKRPCRVEVITGEVPIKKRKAIIESQPDLLCATLDSTRAGINLSYANVAIVAELVWTPSTLIQWEGRFGRHEGANILIQYYVARATADDLLKKIVLSKLDKFAGAVGKTDDKLNEDLRGLEAEGAAERMRRLYEKLKAEE